MSEGMIAFSRKGVLHTYDLATNHQRRYSGVPLMVTPAWHPSDGKTVACGRQYVYLLDTETGELERLTEGSGYDGDPTWSPDGKYIVAARISGKKGLYLLNVSERTYEPIRIKRDVAAHQPAWSPDGKQIACVITENGEHQIYTFDSDNLSGEEKTPVKLTHNRASYMPAWSPDGQNIVFSRKAGLHWSIWIMNADGTEQRQISQPIKGDFAPVWSPDGNFIAFERYDGDSYNIYIMRPDGSDITQITESGGRQPAWWLEE